MESQSDTIDRPAPAGRVVGKTGFLENFRIGHRMGVLTVLALAGFAGLAGT